MAQILIVEDELMSLARWKRLGREECASIVGRVREEGTGMARVTTSGCVAEAIERL
jgi:hypothetical protein